MLKIFAALGAVFLCLAGGPAFAQAAAVAPAGVPWGNAVAGAIDFVAPLVFAAAAVALRKVPAQFTWVLVALRADQLLTTAVNYGVNATKDAVKGKALTLPVGNEVARLALEYAQAHAPMFVKAFGITRLREKILARLEIAEGEAIAPVAPSGV